MKAKTSAVKEKTESTAPKRGSRSISIQATTPYVDAVHILARRRSTTSAALVREALDKVYGAELQECIAFVEGKEHA